MTAFSGNWFQRRAARRKAAAEAYARLLSHALAPVHYVASGVPDTFGGRAGMVTILTSLACDRISRIPGPDAPRIIERLDALVLDGFDAAYREKGVGDASIARKVRKLAQNHAGLGKALFAALKDAESPGQAGRIADVLRRNGVVAATRAVSMATILLGMQARLARQSDAEILHGRLEWTSNAAAQG